MKPEDRPAEAERIGLDLVNDHIKDLGALIRSAEPETDFAKGIAQHPWALIALTSLLLTACGALLGRATDSESRERAAIMKRLDDQGKWNDWMQGRVSAVETGQARLGDDVGRVGWILEEMRRDQLNVLRAAAQNRGDDTAVARIDRKLKALEASKSGG